VEQEQMLARTREYVRHKLSGEGTGHDWWHVERVRVMALRIGHEEGAAAFVVELAALLHDIADWKFHDGDVTAGPRQAQQWLESLGVAGEITRQVCDIIAHISFKGAGVSSAMETLEGKVVQDADRLDAIGAIGIARAFAYGGHKGNEIHNPEQSPVLHSTFEEYRTSRGSTINHFYEKLLLLKDRMHTPAGKRLAEDRHRVMEEFLARFYQEWVGDA
jgi:uncharacterized protein